ncbi:Glyoxylate/hydroxypyruvate reductase A [Roseovarius sp. THAF8]|uniref:2-hydroxyacid dehydrogenase n=1 Tax=Roseovarius sp. THAF8 TaxID=2587846 RepID=UPI00126792D2|nr:glyoxylate/hydroxypyruvate reductase A [Roseovarius sp. THAF8]QFT97322.1 Glyoxylate/hydroxypyruvate reductase A [Roseovarius sp. THAF8]
MSLNILFAARPERWAEYETPLRTAFEAAGLKNYNLSMEIPPEQVDYIVYAPNSRLRDFTPYTRTKGVLNLWAGVEEITGNETLTQPLTRMVDDGLERGMVEWVTGQTLRHHLGMDEHILGQDGTWRNETPPLAKDRPVTILGLGALGRACAETLAHLGFPVTGWSRSQKEIPGITCLSGDDGFARALETAQIVVLLVPYTPQTENLIDAAALSRMPAGGFLINPGRGPLIDDDALIAALDSGHIAHATLDVFRTEPLPPEHLYWAHPRVTVTPHIASETRADTAAEVIAENIRRGEAGEPLLHLVDRNLGY